MRMVFRYLRPHYAAMGGGFVIKLFGTVAELMLPYILSYMLADVITQEVSDMLFWGAVMLVCAILSCVLNVIANRMAARVSQQFAQAMRRDLFDKTLRLSATQTDRFTVPSLESRITSDTYNVHHFVNMAQRLGVRAPIMLLGGIVITLCMDVRLSLVMIALLPLIFVVVYAISRKGVPLYGKVQRAVDGMVRVVREGASGIRVIKALSKTTYEHRRYDEVNNTLVHDETKAGVIMGSVNPIMTLFMNIGSVAVVALGAWYVSKDVSSPETVIAFMQYFTLISMAMMSVTRIFVMYTKCAASAGRIAEVMEAPEDITVADKQQYPDKASDAHIRFEDVSFSYSGKTEQLRHIDFAVDKGGRLGLIGATGAGKSTVIKLLLRFYDVSDGAIYIDGEDIRTISKERLYSLFGSVQQHDFLYADTIAENIRFGRELSDEAIRRAAVIAQADGFISALDDGYDHLLTAHGTNLSGGQKQRLLIARALAGEPSILILDDSSSALDYKTDAALRQALAKSLSHTTVVTVAQRVSAVKDHDWILVLDEGRVTGSGTHDELLRSCETYREISESQMGGAFVE